MSVSETIKNKLDEMTKSEYRVAMYCLGNLQAVVFDTLESLAGKTATSTTSVLRFCRRLGFFGFKNFQDAMRAELVHQPGLPEKFEKSRKNFSPQHAYLQTVEQNMQCVEKTFSNLSGVAMSDAINRLKKAKRIFTFGMKESFALAHYAYTRFLTIRENVSVLSAGYNGEVESLLSLTEEDVCLVFLFHRYTRQTVQILDVLKERKVPVILITSPPLEGVKEVATVLLPCYVDGGIKNTSVAAVCLVDCLFNAVAMESGEETLRYMKQSEALYRAVSILDDGVLKGDKK